MISRITIFFNQQLLYVCQLHTSIYHAVTNIQHGHASSYNRQCLPLHNGKSPVGHVEAEEVLVGGVDEHEVVAVADEGGQLRVGGEVGQGLPRGGVAQVKGLHLAQAGVAA